MQFQAMKKLEKGSVEEMLSERAVKLFGYANTTDFVRAAIQGHYQALLEKQFEEAGKWEAENRSDEYRNEMSNLQGIKRA